MYIVFKSKRTGYCFPFLGFHGIDNINSYAVLQQVAKQESVDEDLLRLVVRICCAAVHEEMQKEATVFPSDIIITSFDHVMAMISIDSAKGKYTL